jgi:hypothetical protein
VIVSLDGFQGSTEKGFRSSGTRSFIVDEKYWLRMADLLVGARVRTRDLRGSRLYLGFQGGPTLMDQPPRQPGRDVRAPRSRQEVRFTFEATAGVELRAGRLRLGPEAVWRQMAGRVALRELYEPRALNGWGVRLRLGLDARPRVAP